MKKLITIIIFFICFTGHTQEKPIKTESKVQKIIKDKKKEVYKLRSKRNIYNKKRTKLC